MAPTLQPGRLSFGHLIHEARTDDARLTLALARTAAVDLGAAVANRAEVVSISRNTRGDLVGVRVQPAGQRTFQVATRSVVIAAGAGAADVGGLPSRTEQDAAGSCGSHPAKGVFVSVPRHRLPVDVAVVVPAHEPLGGPVVVVPWETHTYLGVTRPATGDAHDASRCCGDDVQYLLGAVSASFAAGLVAKDISGSWACGHEGGRRSRDDRSMLRQNGSMLRQNRSVADGIVAVSGGRLTTYRTLAADAVDAIVAQLDERTKLRVRRRSCTQRLPLRGAVGWTDVRNGTDLGRPWPDTMLQHLAGRYGWEARTVLAMVEHEPDLGRPLVEGLQYLRAEALYAVRYEMAGSLVDVLERRTRARLLDREATAQAALDCAELIGTELGWDAHRRAAEVFGVLDDMARERAALSSPTAEADAN
jgi:glycerol-3-phosphate dehydrogenase